MIGFVENVQTSEFFNSKTKEDIIRIKNAFIKEFTIKEDLKLR